MLEAAVRCGARRVRGVLNGTANFVLSRIADGADTSEAIADAQRLGLAEADPSRDLDGRDSLDKLRVLALVLGVDTDGGDTTHADARAARPGAALRQVATLDANGCLKVALEDVEPGDALRDLPGEWNAAEVIGDDGSTLVIRGRGAGRWPTAEAVVADVLEIDRAREIGGDADAVLVESGAGELAPVHSGQTS
ncbi:MAG: hypothetical protein ACIAQU_02705 [Phycisphaerales bacterium JB064]